MISKDVLAQWKQWARRDDWHLYFVGSDIRQMIGEIEKLQSRVTDPSVDRLYRAINGLDGDDADQRAELFIHSHLDGFIPSGSRALIKLVLAQNFEELYQRVKQAQLSAQTEGLKQKPTITRAPQS